jgi:hypothetical protein
MFARLMHRRDWVTYVRQATPLWELALLAVLTTGITQLFPGSVFLVAAILLLLVWDWTGQWASSILRMGAGSATIHRGRLARTAGLTCAAGLAMTTIVGWSWWMYPVESDLPREDPVSLVLVASLLGGCLVFVSLRQSWRLTVALPSLITMLAGLAWFVGVCWEHPSPWPADGLRSFERLSLLLVVGLLLEIWGNRIGRRTAWPRKVMRAVWLIPLMAGMLLLLELAPASLSSESMARRSIWLGAWVLEAALLLSLWIGGMVRQRGIAAVGRRLWGQSAPEEFPSEDLLRLGSAVPALLLLPSAHPLLWITSLVLFAVTGLCLGGMRGIDCRRLVRTSGKATIGPAEPPRIPLAPATPQAQPLKM